MNARTERGSRVRALDAFRNEDEDEEEDAKDASREGVITSYSIHYTKLYDRRD